MKIGHRNFIHGIGQNAVGTARYRTDECNIGSALDLAAVPCLPYRGNDGHQHNESGTPRSAPWTRTGRLLVAISGAPACAARNAIKSVKWLECDVVYHRVYDSMSAWASGGARWLWRSMARQEPENLTSKLSRWFLAKSCCHWLIDCMEQMISRLGLP